jgi:hypothetical protein
MFSSSSQDVTRIVQYKERPRNVGAGKEMGFRVSGEVVRRHVCALELKRGSGRLSSMSLIRIPLRL